MLFRIKRSDKWVGISALSLWILGIVLGVISINNIASGFAEASEKAEPKTVVNSGMDTISVRVNIDKDMLNDDYDNHWNRKHRFERRWKLIHTDEITIKLGDPSLNIIPATGDSIEMIVFKKSNGRTKKEAQDRCNTIAYEVTQQGNEFIFPAAFSIGENQAWKFQEVDVELRMPIGTVIFLDATCKDLLYDVTNVSETYDEEMVDRRWIMTAKGLQCIDCAGLGLQTNPVKPAALKDSIPIAGDTIAITK